MGFRSEGMGKRVANFDMADWVDKEQRKANIRLAIILGLIAIGFYLMMIFANPL